MTKRQFAVIAARIREELSNISLLQQELHAKGILKTGSGQTKINLKITNQNDTFTLRGIGSVLHDFYVSVENIFKLIAREIDDKVPTGDNWHKELLNQMLLNIPEIRPALVSRPTGLKLEEFRAFRHVFRNVYGFNLAGDRLFALLRKFPETAEQFEQEILQFLADMEQVLP
ncbi:MAG: hypothetical protein ACOX5W_09980 [Bacillota bacterium]|jgi:hypothetical protein